MRRDTASLAQCRRVFTIARVVTDRLKRFNGLDSRPLYHPPPIADLLYTERATPYIFAPSRLESLKRLDLLVDAMLHVRSPVAALIAGEGGQQAALLRQIEALGLHDRVRLVGPIAPDEMPHWYARCLGVFFGPHQEDMGYITLEAMLAAKPVITCTDSGGPLEFVVHNETGYVVAPQPGEVAAAIDRLAGNHKLAADLGSAGRQRYHDLGISWQSVTRALVA
jgi:glycosyltransferase involved in cell wall biosynthesis